MTVSATRETAQPRPERHPPHRRDFAHSPLLVFYEVTQACDLACAHCRACAVRTAHPGELHTGESLRLIDQLAEFPIPPRLILTGGDPLKRSDIYELIRHARRRSLDVSITPSATPLVTRGAIRRLRRAGISQMAVSIDWPDAESHDRLRGIAGSFQRSLRILGDARAEGISTQVNTVLTPDNFDRIDEMADRFGRLGIGMWSVFFLVPVGRAAGAARLSADECEWAFGRLWRQSLRQPYAIKTTEAPHYRRFVLQRRGRAPVPDPSKRHATCGVNDGRGVMFIGHTGLIHPSGFLPIVCGVFPESHVVQVYQKSPVFQALRNADRLEGKCGVCEYRHVCGGSRARAYAVTGDFLAQEPDCAYLPRAWAARERAPGEPVSALAGEIAAVREAFRDRRSRQPASRALRRLIWKLLEQFEREEERGIFGSPTTSSPRSAIQAEALLWQHAQLAMRLVELEQQVSQGVLSEAEWPRLAEQFEQFVVRLQEHEQAERRFRQQVQDDIGATT